MNIAFVVTSSGISGGHNVIFEHAYNLKQVGHQVDIIGRNLDQFKFAYNWHDRANQLNFKVIERTLGTCNYDMVIATNFHSVFHLPMISSKYYCFFMQANESDFISDNNIILKKWLLSILEFNLPTIVSASWMKRYLHGNFKRESFLCLSGMRKDLFNISCLADDKVLNYKLRLLVEGAIEAPHKNVIKTIELCLKSNARNVSLLTPSIDTDKIPKEVLIHKNIPQKELAKVYGSYDVLVKLSTSEGMFGPPLEMFHCGGTTISYDVPGHEEYLVDGINSIVVPMNSEDLVLEAINSLNDNKDLLTNLKRGSLDTATNWPDWEIATKRFEEGLVWASSNSHINKKDLLMAIKEKTKKYLREKWQDRKNSLLNSANDALEH